MSRISPRARPLCHTARSWNARDTTEISLNCIWTEHVEKERKYVKPKTTYTCNPFPSIEMNNGLGMRSKCSLRSHRWHAIESIP